MAVEDADYPSAADDDGCDSQEVQAFQNISQEVARANAALAQKMRTKSGHSLSFSGPDEPREVEVPDNRQDVMRKTDASGSAKFLTDEELPCSQKSRSPSKASVSSRGSKGSQSSGSGSGSRKSKSSMRSSTASFMSLTNFNVKRMRSEASSQEITEQVVSEATALRKEIADTLAKSVYNLNSRVADQNLKLGQEVRRKLQKRIKGADVAALDLSRCLNIAAPVSYLLEQSIQELEMEHRNFWPMLSVAKQRQEIRELCPTGELDKDHMQQALRYEQKVVAKARREIILAKERGKALLKQLQERMRVVQQTLDVKHSHASHNREVMMVAMCKKTPTVELISRDAMTVEDQSYLAKVAQDEVKKLDDLSEEANKFRLDSKKIIKDFQGRAKEAADNSQKLFARHSAEMTRLANKCEKEMHKSFETISTVEVILTTTKHDLDKMKKQVESSRANFEDTKSSSVERKRTTLLDAVEANHQSQMTRYIALQEQLEWATRLMSDLTRCHEALEEDFNMKRLAVKVTNKCLKVTPSPDQETRAADARKQLAKRAALSEEVYVELKPGTLRQIRRRIRTYCSLDDEKHDLDHIFAKIIKTFGNELTDQDVRVVLRKVFKFGPRVISDDEITGFCARLDTNLSGTIDAEEFKAFLDEKDGAGDEETTAQRVTKLKAQREKVTLGKQEQKSQRSLGFSETISSPR